MVLIINPHHMGFNRLKTKRGQWCTQRELIDLFLHPRALKIFSLRGFVRPKFFNMEYINFPFFQSDFKRYVKEFFYPSYGPILMGSSFFLEISDPLFT